MTASYPTTVKSFTTKVDFTDTVLAAHVNDLQKEVVALQTEIGTDVAVGSGWVGAVDFATTNWNTLKDRLANIEYGLKDVYDDYVSDVGGSVIIPSGTSVKGLVIRATSGQSANLLETQNSSSTVVTRVDSSGFIYTRGEQLVPVIYSASQPTGANFAAGTIWIDSSSDVDATAIETGVQLSDTLMLMGG